MGISRELSSRGLGGAVPKISISTSSGIRPVLDEGTASIFSRRAPALDFLASSALNQTLA